MNPILSAEQNNIVNDYARKVGATALAGQIGGQIALAVIILSTPSRLTRNLAIGAMGLTVAAGPLLSLVAARLREKHFNAEEPILPLAAAGAFSLLGIGLAFWMKDNYTPADLESFLLALPVGIVCVAASVFLSDKVIDHYWPTNTP